VGDRADRAERLRDDQVGSQRAQEIAVELIDRSAGGDALANRRVDPPRVELRRERVARNLRQAQRRRRVVALMRHRDEILAETEREAELGRMRHEAYDSHRKLYGTPI
jgi:hypothetical protein